MFYYTNFIQETNVWWLRRVRPIWMGATFLYCYYFFHRYYFFGKHAALSQRKHTPEQLEQMAQLNKRSLGYGAYYKPTYEKSIFLHKQGYLREFLNFSTKTLIFLISQLKEVF